MNSLIIPVYHIAPNLDLLIASLNELNQKVADLEHVFVCDGIPCDYQLLEEKIPSHLNYQLILQSKNFGSYKSILTGIINCRGTSIAVMSQDGQEPIDLIVKMFEILNNDTADIVFAYRQEREDKRFFSKLFWQLYGYIFKQMPAGGVDMFAINQTIKNELAKMTEHNQFLVGTLFDLGFRREFIPYKRLDRNAGKSTFTFMKRLNLALDSIFVFTDLPIKCLMATGLAGILFSVVYSLLIILQKIFFVENAPLGWSSSIFLLCLFSSILLFSISILGQYIYLTYQNSKQKPITYISKRIYNNELYKQGQ
jgi:glycosyltransferase involved in cell wall biosynthesis